MSATYFVSARTEQSSMMVGTADAADALRRAREMVSARSVVSVTTGDGAIYSVEEFEAFVSGYAAAERGEPDQGQASLNT